MFASTGLKIISSEKKQADKLFDEFFINAGFELEDLDFDELIENEEEAKKYLPKIFSLKFEEGMSYIELNSQYLLEIWGAYLSQEYREYFTLATEEFMYDAAFTIPRDEVALKVIAREEYIVRYPDAVYTVQMKRDFESLLYFYLNGIDNSPVFDYDTDILTEEAKLSFENTIKNYPGTKTAAVTKQYYDALQKNNFKRSKLSDQIIEHYAPGFEVR